MAIEKTCVRIAYLIQAALPSSEDNDFQKTKSKVNAIAKENIKPTINDLMHHCSNLDDYPFFKA